MKWRVSLFLFLFLGSLFCVTLWLLFPSTNLDIRKKSFSLGNWISELQSPDILNRIHAITQLGALGKSASFAIPALIETNIPLSSEYLITDALQKIGPPPL
ncbi:MAG: hypothetical protein AABZ60_13770, partial [Planctomycetota bacterium]